MGLHWLQSWPHTALLAQLHHDGGSLVQPEEVSSCRGPLWGLDPPSWWPTSALWSYVARLGAPPAHFLVLSLLATLKTPSKLLLLDEATASVDTVTDGKIQRAIRNDTRFCSATRIIIAHRLQTILDADSVIVMDKGTVGEIGPPGELLRKEPYKDNGAIFAGLAADSGIEMSHGVLMN
eukprot:COSAG02_NODE_420_length_22610_cov_22.488694_16_plen_179_part_00